MTPRSGWKEALHIDERSCKASMAHNDQPMNCISTLTYSQICIEKYPPKIESETLLMQVATTSLEKIDHIIPPTSILICWAIWGHFLWVRQYDAEAKFNLKETSCPNPSKQSSNQATDEWMNQPINLSSTNQPVITILVIWWFDWDGWALNVSGQIVNERLLGHFRLILDLLYMCSGKCIFGCLSKDWGPMWPKKT